MENSLKRKLADDALTFCLGVNQARTPNIAMIGAAAGSDVQYLLRGARADIERMKTLPVAGR
jgi:hypothetical protein